MWLDYMGTAVALWLLLSALTVAMVSVGRRNTFLLRTTLASSSSSSPALRIGLVIAHPDDESMFFVPTMAHVRAQGHALALLCLSTGNADGLGAIRRTELRAAAGLLGIQPEHVHLVDDPVHLKDGMQVRWNVVEARGHIERFVQDERLDVLLTFDEDGVSGHLNHVATFDAVQSFVRLLPENAPLAAFSLVSTSLWRKYSGVLDSLLSWREEVTAATQHGSSPALPSFVFIHHFEPQLSYRCMQAHASQWVWYRRLFVVFSRYTCINTLQRIHSRKPVPVDRAKAE